jgi:hypothetical protein
MANPYRVLFVIEDDRYAKPLIEYALQNYDLELNYFNNWEEAISELDADFQNFHAVIIDGKGKLTTNDNGNNPKLVSQAVADLRERRGRNKFIPYVFLSEHKQIKEFVIDKFFEKNAGENELFQYLIQEIKNNARNKIQNKYYDAFQAFGEGYLDDDDEQNLYEVLLNFEENKWTSNSFNPLRKIIESIYLDLHDKDYDLLPQICMHNDEKVNFKFCELRLAGKPIFDPKDHSKKLLEAIDPKDFNPKFPDHLCILINPITTICHKASHRNYSKNIGYYSLGIIIHGVLDMLIWYKKYVDDNFK